MFSSSWNRKLIEEEKNIAKIRRFVDEVFNAGHIDVLDEIAAIDWEDHSNRGLPEPGRNGWKKRTQALRETFPDIHMTVDDIFAHGDRVVIRYTVEGNEKRSDKEAKEWKHVRAPGITIARFKNGRIQENWNQFDELTMMRQLGNIV
jgi:predicted ester cyclase